MPNPDVEVLLPVHNEAESIESTVLEIYGELSRTVNVGFIICEDGSKDNTQEILRRLAKELPMRLKLGDAVARVTRGASLLSLVLSCFGLGTLLSLKANGRTFGGIISVAGLFFYGSTLALFTNAPTSSGHVTRAILFNIPDVGVPEKETLEYLQQRAVKGLIDLL
jgi:glycosyltransferase involved in cell wall biosynthesis